MHSKNIPFLALKFQTKTRRILERYILSWSNKQFKRKQMKLIKAYSLIFRHRQLPARQMITRNKLIMEKSLYRQKATWTKAHTDGNPLQAFLKRLINFSSCELLFIWAFARVCLYSYQLSSLFGPCVVICLVTSCFVTG